jgi:hypothetical protein
MKSPVNFGDENSNRGTEKKVGSRVCGSKEYGRSAVGVGSKNLYRVEGNTR